MTDPNKYQLDYERTEGYWSGKNLYRKTVDLGALPNATSANVAHGIANVDASYCRVLEVWGIDEATPATTSLSPGVNAQMDTTNIVVTTTTDLSDYNGYALLEYTKS